MKNSVEIEEALFFLKEESYEGTHPYFYNSTDYPAIIELENNWKIVRDEILGSITTAEIDAIKNINPPYLSDPNAWKNIYFYNFGWKKHKNCHRFPKTHALLKKNPNCVFGGITVLRPHSRVLPHNGETNTTIRCHLGLKIPAPLPTCGVQVGDEQQSWQEGKVMMFSDAHRHNTWNESEEDRYVLVFDIVREEYASQKHWICAKALGALSLKYFYNDKPYLKKIPMPILQGIHFLFSFIWYLYLPLQNKFSFLP